MKRHQFMDICNLVLERQQSMIDGSFDNVDWEEFFYYNNLLEELLNTIEDKNVESEKDA